LRYQLKVLPDGSEGQRIPLTDFHAVSLLEDSLNGGDWPSEIPTDVLGGIVVRQFSLLGNYTVVFAVDGRMTQNGDDQSCQVAAHITVSRRPTLQVHSVNCDSNAGLMPTT